MDATEVSRGDSACAAFAELTHGMDLSTPQTNFFRDCEGALLIKKKYGFLAARQAPKKLFSKNALVCTEIGIVYVQPKQRGRGHALALLEHVQRVASTPLIVVYAQTCIQNPIMARLYRSAGFKIVFSTLKRHAVDALSNQSEWEDITGSELKGTHTAVIVKSREIKATKLATF